MFIYFPNGCTFLKSPTSKDQGSYYAREDNNCGANEVFVY